MCKDKKEVKYEIGNQESFEFQCEDKAEYKEEKEGSKQAFLFFKILYFHFSCLETFQYQL